MKKLLLFCLFAFAAAFSAQAQITFTAPVAYTTGVPTGAPSGQGSRLRIDLLTGWLYEWSPVTSSWINQGDGIDQIAGTVPPAYAPGIAQSWFAINGANPPQLYQYNGSGTSWTCLNCAAGGVASVNGLTGTVLLDLSLTGTTLSLTGDATTVSFSGWDTNASNDITTGTTANGDLSGTYPNPVVDGLQNRPLAATAPLTGQVLKWDGSQWKPDADNDSGGGGGGGSDYLGTGFSGGGGIGYIPEETSVVFAGDAGFDAGYSGFGSLFGRVTTVDGPDDYFLGFNVGGSNYFGTVRSALDGRFKTKGYWANTTTALFEADYGGINLKSFDATGLKNGKINTSGGVVDISRNDAGGILLNGSGVALKADRNTLVLGAEDAPHSVSRLITIVPDNAYANTVFTNSDGGFDFYTTTGALVPPRLTTSQRDALPTQEDGALIRNIDVPEIQVYNANTDTWEALTPPSMGGSNAPETTEYDASGTYTYSIPTGATSVEITVVGAGGGGGAGRRGASETFHTGGSGGGQGGCSILKINLADISNPSSLDVTVGAAGAGGSGQTTNSTDGANGNDGGESKVESGGTLLVWAGGGVKGIGGKNGNTGQAGGNAGAGMFYHSNEIINSSGAGGGGGYGRIGGGVISNAPNQKRFTPGGGGGSSGSDDVDDVFNAGAGGSAFIGQLTGGTAGTSGGDGGNATVPTYSPVGPGGGGGASSVTTTGGAGGSGARGGGGGGGGSSLNGNTSGGGGNGGDGYVKITAYFN